MIGVPGVDAPLAVVEIVAPVTVVAVKEVAAIGEVVAAFKGVGDRAAVHGVLGAAFQVGVVDIHTVFAEIAVKAPVGIFAVQKIVAKRIFIVELMHKNAWSFILQLLEFLLDFCLGPRGDFVHLLFITFLAIRLVEDMVLLARETDTAKTIVAADAVVTGITVGALFAVLEKVAVVALHAVYALIAKFAVFAKSAVAAEAIFARFIHIKTVL